MKGIGYARYNNSILRPIVFSDVNWPWWTLMVQSLLYKGNIASPNRVSPYRALRPCQLHMYVVIIFKPELDTLLFPFYTYTWHVCTFYMENFLQEWRIRTCYISHGISYPTKRQLGSTTLINKLYIYFSSEPLSKTGYWVIVCYGWFHLHRLPRAARSVYYMQVFNLCNMGAILLFD